MASFSDSIRLTVDIITGTSSKSPFKSLRDDIDEAEGSFGKLKAAGSSVFSTIQDHAGAFALSAGTALIGFGVKAVGAMEDVALGAGDLRDSLGLTADEASRWQEVAGDLGISNGTLSTVIGKMNQTLGKSPSLFRDLGIEVVKTASGATDVNATFLNVIARLNQIEDPAKRAAAAQQILGKSWKDAAELIQLGAKGVKDRLDEVSGAKIVTDAQIAEARKFRDTMDDLHDQIENLSLAVGSRLIPTLTDAVSGLNSLIGPAKGVFDVLTSVSDVPVLKYFSGFTAPAKLATDALGAVKDAWHGMFGGGGDDVQAKTEAVTQAMWDAVEAARGTADAFESAGEMAAKAAGAGAMQPLVDALIAAGAAARVTATQTDEVSTTFDDMDSAADKAADSANNLSDALDEVFGSATDLQGASDKTRANIEALTQSFNTNGVTLDENTAKGRSNRAAVRDQADAINDYTAKLAESGATSSTVNAQYGALREQLVQRMLPAFRGNRQAAEDYINTLGLTPHNVTTAVQLQGDQEAKARVQSVLASLGTIPHAWAVAIQASIDRGDYSLAESQLNQLARSRIATIQIQTTGGAPIRGSSSGLTNIRAVAGGGDVAAGEAVVVGDRFGVNSPSAELFVPKVPGTVVNRDQIAAAVGRGGGGGDTYNVSFVSSGNVSRDFSEYQRWQWRQNAQPRKAS